MLGGICRVVLWRRVWPCIWLGVFGRCLWGRVRCMGRGVGIARCSRVFFASRLVLLLFRIGILRLGGGRGGGIHVLRLGCLVRSSRLGGSIGRGSRC